MKKILQVIGVLTLFTVSFSYNNEVAEVVKLTDGLLDEIKVNATNYNTKKVEATINEKTIIPGINGKFVNIDKSYNTMKQIGFFDENKLVYDIDKVKYTLKENNDKYIIGGNKLKKQIALVFKLGLNDDIDKILKELNIKKTKATFFIDTAYAKMKPENLKNIVANGHIIGNLSEKEDYIWLNTLILSISNQQNHYCITVKEDNERLKFCDKHDDYTINVNKIISDNPLIEVKNSLYNGQIIYFDINNKLLKELSNIENYIISKGYELVSLETLLQE